ncbi:MAG: acyltransferase [Bacteroidales bacterium]|nr:acyltransferase [Bacteroidales bacterium]
MKNQKIQIFRAMAIIAVVMIHTTPPGEWQIFCKPFINFAVATFIFLSGYLTKDQGEDWKAFYLRRIKRVALAYLIWSILYSIPDMIASGPVALVKNLLTANANVSLYYIFVYIQFVLLTPWIIRLARSRYRHLGWLIAPVSVLIFKYYGLLAGVEMSKYASLIWSDLCLGWFTFYYLGIMLGNGIMKRSYDLRVLCVVYVVSLLVQMGEGYLWFLLDPVQCGSQLKLSSLLSSSIFMLILQSLMQKTEWQPRSRLMVLIGDNSFGIYLSHLMVMGLLAYLPAYSFIPFPLNSLLILTISLLLCMAGTQVRRLFKRC